MQNITERIKWSEADLTAIEEFYDLPPALLEADRADKDYRSTAYPQAHSLREIRKKGGTP